jgi:CRISPR/Cas system-associated exonuclease Cas4 (RecB family)
MKADRRNAMKEKNNQVFSTLINDQLRITQVKGQQIHKHVMESSKINIQQFDSSRNFHMANPNATEEQKKSVQEKMTAVMKKNEDRFFENKTALPKISKEQAIQAICFLEEKKIDGGFRINMAVRQKQM